MSEFWKKAFNPPNVESGKWSKEVVVLTNYGDVFMLSYFNGNGGCWQRPHRFNKGEEVELWIEIPDEAATNYRNRQEK